MYTDDIERGSSPASDNFMAFDFSEKSVRMAFIRKVYAILMTQLLISIAFICIFIYVPAIGEYTSSEEGIWTFYTSIGVFFACVIALSCCGDVRRQFPTNMILLGIFTVAMSFMLGIVSANYAPQEVLIAIGITAGVTLALTLFAFQTKIDFTMCGGMLFVALICLILFGFVCAIIQSEFARIAYAALGALIFSLYLVFDTQLMLGGGHKYAISPEEYVFAALNLYLDIVNLFLIILSLLGGGRK